MKNILLTCVVLLFASGSLLAQQGPVVYLPLDANLEDASGNALHALDGGSELTKFVRDTERGRVAQFPINAHAILPLDPKLDFGTNDFAVSFWLKVNNEDHLLTDGDPVVIGNKDWGSGGNRGFLVALDGANQTGAHLWTVNASDGNGARLDWDADENATPDLVDGTWHHVVVSFDRDGTMDVYMDGVLRQSDPDPTSKNLSTIPGDIAPDDKPFTLMQDNTGTYNPDFEGFLDDVLIYNRKLTAAEVTSLHDKKFSALGATVYLPFDGDINDASGNGLNGTDAGSEITKFKVDATRGTVADFAAGAHVTLPLDPKLDFGTNDFSVAFWLKVDNDGTLTDSDPVIVGNKDWGSGGNRGFLVALDGANQTGAHMWTVNVSDNNGARLDWDADENATPDLVDGTWHFVAVTFDRDATMNVYMDGVLRQSDPDPTSKNLSTIPGDLAPDDKPFTIMQDNTGTYSADFAGLLDEIRIWNGKALTADEVMAVYKLVPPAGELASGDLPYGSTAFLTFNTTLEDASGNDFNATDAGTESTRFVKDPKRGDVALFAPAAHATLPLVPELDLSTTDFSVGFWIKVNPSLPIPSDPVVIGNKDWNSGENKGFIVGPQDADDSGSHLFEVNIADGTNRVDWKADENGSGTIKDGNWHLVVASFDRDAKLNVYFDGVLKQTSVEPGAFDMTKITGTTDAGLPITIMQDGTGTYGADFTALLDNVRIWTRVVGQAEVTDIWTNDKGTGQGGGEIILGDIKEALKQFLAYPNPTRSGDKIYVNYKLSSTSDINLSLIDIQGRQLHSSVERVSSNEGTLAIDAPVEPGLYLVKVQSIESTQVLKVMVVR